MLGTGSVAVDAKAIPVQARKARVTMIFFMTKLPFRRRVAANHVVELTRIATNAADNFDSACRIAATKGEYRGKDFGCKKKEKSRSQARPGNALPRGSCLTVS